MALNKRLKRMERARLKHGHDPHRTHRLLQMIARNQVMLTPELKLVRPEHTDPETYEEVQETLARAEGRRVEIRPPTRDLSPGIAGIKEIGEEAKRRTELFRQACKRASADSTKT